MMRSFCPFIVDLQIRNGSSLRLLIWIGALLLGLSWTGWLSAEEASTATSNEGTQASSISAAPRPAGHFVLKTVVIDPGHGGKDPGYIGPGSVQEKKINLDVAVKLGAILTERGINVRLLRTTDRHLRLEERGRLANISPAEETLFVSLHCNSWEGEGASGIETYVFDFNASDEGARRVALRENFGQEMNPLDYILGDLHHRGSAPYSLQAARLLQSTLAQTLKVRDRHIRRAPLKVLGYVQVPAVLVEMGFLSNPQEARQLQQKEYQIRIATALADGIQAFAEAAATNSQAEHAR